VRCVTIKLFKIGSTIETSFNKKKSADFDKMSKISCPNAFALLAIFLQNGHNLQYFVKPPFKVAESAPASFHKA
jgi:hypothetical protein